MIAEDKTEKPLLETACEVLLAWSNERKQHSTEFGRFDHSNLSPKSTDMASYVLLMNTHVFESVLGRTWREGVF